MSFNYKEAFKRNLGLVTSDELEVLRRSRIALPGMGGVGGSHLIQLVRAGIGKFNIADFDVFDLGNFNRQYGATMSTIGKEKVHVMKDLAIDVNPEVDVQTFRNGVNAQNMDNFLKDVDLVIDTIDVFQQKMRRQIFKEAQKRNIPIITCGPISFGTAYFTSLPEGPEYDDFLQVNDEMSEDELLIHFLVALTPKFFQAQYYINEYIDIAKGQVPSSSSGISLSTGVAVTEAIKILLKRPHLKPLPYVHHIDIYLNRHATTKLPLGNRSWLQKIKIKSLKKQFNILKSTSNDTNLLHSETVKDAPETIDEIVSKSG